MIAGNQNVYLPPFPFVIITGYNLYRQYTINILTSVITRLASPLLNLGIAGEVHDIVAPVNVNVRDAKKEQRRETR